MKVYTFFTETHKVLLPIFLNSFPFEDGFDLEIKYFPQECQSGNFESNGWDKTMRKKIEYILYSLDKTNENDFFVHSDIDIQFFGNIKNDLLKLINESNKDILFQDDNNIMCMGFFICKKNNRTLNFFNKILSDLHNHKNDQIAVNYHLNYMDISYDKLPNRYYTIGLNHKLWNGESINFEIPSDILMHHANYTIGVENKIKLLNIIKQKLTY